MWSRWQLVFVSSITAAVALVQLFPQYSVRGSYALTFAPIFLLQFLGLATWSVILWPKLFSPLRHLPQAPVGYGFLKCA
jgi:hypothetical protein